MKHVITAPLVPIVTALLSLIPQFCFSQPVDTALVQVSKHKQSAISLGTGFAVTETGDLLTNEHVVSGCTYVTSRRGSNQFNGTVIASDRESDLAVVQLDLRNDPSEQYRDKGTLERLFKGPRKGAVATLRQSPPLRAGEQAISYGFPLNGVLSTDGNLTIGNVSALRGLRDDPKEIQITTPIQVGNSGGPVLDHSGNIIGVAVAKLDALTVLGAVGDLPQNVNFAINLQTLREFLTKNKIWFAESPSRDELSPAEIGDRAKLFTYSIECNTTRTARQQDALPLSGGISRIEKTSKVANHGNDSTERVIVARRGDSISSILRNVDATPEEMKAIGAALGFRGREGGIKEGDRVRVLLSPAPASWRMQAIRVIVIGNGRIDAVAALSDSGKYVAVDPRSIYVPGASGFK
jgi:hypothetical protein